MKDTVESLDAKIDDARKSVRDIEKKIRQWAERRDALLIERNKDNFGNIEWLINNPDTPGQYEAMRGWLVNRFGSEYEGILASGYRPEVNQQAFNIVIFGKYEKPARVDRFVKNVKAFFSECLHMFKAGKDGFVYFGYATGQYSGCFDLAYRPSDNTWWTTQVRYHRTVSEVRHESLDAAISAAQAIAATIDD